ncbi:Alkylglycerol monooxygenase-like protein [Tolypocladium paradoxum]|uniref:Alkylglycerol monooxygenase-like protein n=1 Tax=Tolypocladium paradoxum TaxID=94208 RepID=A0A2S4KYL2_9HYPO|nr:Alkylglycerol monooxygenase-like protein [Tolypocladium paradoxum]
MATKPNPKDSMKSTWRLGDRSKWTRSHWLIDLVDGHHVALDTPVPVHSKADKIPYMPQWPQHLWVIFYALIPLALHQAWLSYTGHQRLGKIAALILYFTAFNAVAIREIHILRRLAHKYGFLDGDVHERDGVPDAGAGKVTASLVKTTGSRLAMAIVLSYNPSTPPAAALGDWTWWMWLSLEIGLYCIILDFWFYWYHRAMHDVPFLWKYHRTHHLTKHPNPLLTAYADHEQEFFDMVGVPFMTYLTFRAIGLPLGFYDWWICHQYVVFTEVWGHSGLRIHLSPPTTMSWFLQMFEAEIVIEDHDLHHRKGWRKSHNYGKQTRLWDRIFGTCTDRIESVEANIDYNNQAHMPIF